MLPHGKLARTHLVPRGSCRSNERKKQREPVRGRLAGLRQFLPEYD
jgi:hypothetical protein